MSEPIDRFKMETNFDGLIQLLAKHLYSEPDVFVRELIQNGHDAIERRIHIEPDIGGRIDVTLQPANRRIVFHDNGVGMDATDIHNFLSVIGSSGTLEAMQQMQAQGISAAHRLIGQFGIGFLSAFGGRTRSRFERGRSADAWHSDGKTQGP